jgi:hypothetical protein
MRRTVRTVAAQARKQRVRDRQAEDAEAAIIFKQ